MGPTFRDRSMLLESSNRTILILLLSAFFFCFICFCFLLVLVCFFFKFRLSATLPNQRRVHLFWPPGGERGPVLGARRGGPGGGIPGGARGGIPGGRGVRAACTKKRIFRCNFDTSTFRPRDPFSPPPLPPDPPLSSKLYRCYVLRSSLIPTIIIDVLR